LKKKGLPAPIQRKLLLDFSDTFPIILRASAATGLLFHWEES